MVQSIIMRGRRMCHRIISFNSRRRKIKPNLSMFIFCFVVIGGSFVATGALADSRYGSIVFSKEANGGYAWGIAWSFNSHSAARDRAIRECQSRRGTSCYEVGWFRDACGALAIGGNNGYGSGWGTTHSVAKEYALGNCRQAGNEGCRIAAAECAR